MKAAGGNIGESKQQSVYGAQLYKPSSMNLFNF